MDYKPKTKKPKAIWMRAFPKQAKALRPENTKAGGVKARSQSETVRMDVYRPIAELFKLQNPLCDACQQMPHNKVLTRPITPNWTDDVHHKHGRSGLLLFDVRYFLAVCRWCHEWIHNNPAEAKKLGLIK